jgi:hypothetical protein
MKYMLLAVLFVPSASYAQLELPKVLVNHDAYAHQYDPLLTGSGKPLTNTALTPRQLQDYLSASLHRASRQKYGLVMNGTYGSNQLWLTHDSARRAHYIQYWQNKMLEIGGSSTIDVGRLDSLVKGSFTGENFFAPLNYASNAGYLKIVSYRINDHHHLDSAKSVNEILARGSLGPPSPLYSGFFARAMAAMTPAFQSAFDKLNLISQEKDNYAAKAAGSFCADEEVGHSDYRYDLSVASVRSTKINELKLLLNSFEVDGVEIDMTRALCNFADGTSLNARRAAMSGFFRALFTEIDLIRAATGKSKFLLVRLPSLPNLADDGIVLADLRHPALAAVIVSSPYPYTDHGFDLDQFRSSLLSTTKIYVDLFQINDTLTIDGQRIRRPASLKEIYTTAHLYRKAGADGFSLFNFQYIRLWLNDAGMPVADAIPEVVACLRVATCYQGTLQSYYWKRANFASTSATKVAPSLTLTMTLKRPVRPASSNRWERAFLLQIRQRARALSHSYAWKSLLISVKVNGVPVVRSEGGPAYMFNPTREQVAIENSYGIESATMLRLRDNEWLKQLEIPSNLFRDGSNTIELTVMNDSRGFFSNGSLTLANVELHEAE